MDHLFKGFINEVDNGKLGRIYLMMHWTRQIEKDLFNDALNTANWEQFQRFCSTLLHQTDITDADIPSFCLLIL